MMSRSAVLFATMLGMAACGAVKDLQKTDKAAHTVNKGLRCTYAAADGFDEVADTIEDVMNAFKSCAHIHQEGGCAGDILESTAEFLQALGAVFELVECFHPNLDPCASSILSTSGSALDLGLKIKDLIAGVCKSSQNVGMGITTVNQTSASGGACAGGITQVIGALTKTGLGIALTVEICKVPDSKELCVSQALELTGSIANIVAELINSVASCTGHATFNAACGAAITGLVEDSLQLTGDSIALSKACKKSTGGQEPLSRLYDREINQFHTVENSSPQFLPWATSGLLFLMMPIVYRAGKRGGAKDPNRLEGQVMQPSDSELE